jgi:hypothetical protein
MLDVPHHHEVVLLLIEAHVDCRLFCLREGGVVNRVAHHDHANVGWGIAGVVWKTKWYHRVEGIEFPCHHHSFPAMLEALGTRETLEGTLKMTAQILNALFNLQGGKLKLGQE